MKLILQNVDVLVSMREGCPIKKVKKYLFDIYGVGI